MANDPHSPMHAPEDLLTVTELASLLRTTPATVRYWRHQGYGPPGLKMGRRVVYRRRDVDAFLSSLEEDENK